MSECQHQWRDVTGVKDPDEETTVLMCDLCDHLWLPDFDDQPPSVPRPQ